MRKRKIFLSRFIVAMLVIAMCACSTEEPKKPTDATSSTFTDSRDGNVYKYVKIGNQVWMAENLRYLPSIVGPDTDSKTTPYYYVYGYNGSDVNAAKATANYATYGVLYNWTAACNSCPAGWHLPSDAEWKELIDNLGEASVAGSKLKSISGWSSDGNGTDEYGFTALPGGYRHGSGAFTSIGDQGYWWSATDNGPNYAWSRDLISTTSYVYRSLNNLELGSSVRCVRD
jgi:uncharacterized protein (TIGR02145 family)